MDMSVAQDRGNGAHGDAARALAGKFMTFELAAEAYGVDIVKVREIIGMMAITRVPRAPRFLRGVINLRGKVIPVMDLRVQFGMTPAEPTDQAVIIVVQCASGGRELTMGVLVDQVLEVLSIDASRIQPPPSFGGAPREAAFILGIGKTEQRVVFLLDIGRVLSEADAGTMAEAMEG